MTCRRGRPLFESRESRGNTPASLPSPCKAERRVSQRFRFPWGLGTPTVPCAWRDAAHDRAIPPFSPATSCSLSMADLSRRAVAVVLAVRRQRPVRSGMLCGMERRRRGVSVADGGYERGAPMSPDGAGCGSGRVRGCARA